LPRALAKSRHDGADGNADDLGDIPIGQLFKLPQHKNLPVFQRQRRDKIAQLLLLAALDEESLWIP